MKTRSYNSRFAVEALEARSMMSAVAYADFNNDFVTWVQGEMKAGKTVDQAAAEWKPGARWAGYAPPPDFFGGIKGNIQTAYNELKK